MFINKVDKGIFSVGIDWKYHDSDHENEYYVKPKYNNLKEEMLHYKYLSYRKYNKIVNKAYQYIQTNIAKSMEKGGEMGSGEPIELDALICIIMYCDYTDLSRDFTLSFRKRNVFETLKQINKRNQKYYHWSKILKNTIRHYGQYYEEDDGCNGLLSELCGPLYCGMTLVLNISQFNMWIESPLSTTIHLEVAMKFSGEEGMILEMDNEKGDGQLLKAMDCSWISRYKEEDERYVLCILF